MKPFSGKATVTWSGQGKGPVPAPSLALTGARDGSGQGTNRKMTSPPELIAAAHASSFAMTLATELRTAGCAAHQIDTTATVTMEHIGTRWTMAQVHLEVIATVVNGEQFDFVDATLRAKANCPVSCLLTANISMQAKLQQGPEERLRPARKGLRAGGSTPRSKNSKK